MLRAVSSDRRSCPLALLELNIRERHVGKRFFPPQFIHPLCAEAAMQSNILDSDEVFATEAALPTSEVEGLIVEWTGPDAGEELNNASAEEKTLNGVAVSFVSEEDLQGTAHESQPVNTAFLVSLLLRCSL